MGLERPAFINCFCIQIDKMEAKVVKPLLEYEGVCKKAKVFFTFMYVTLGMCMCVLVGGDSSHSWSVGERGEQAEKLGQSEISGPSKQEENCILTPQQDVCALIV